MSGMSSTLGANIKQVQTGTLSITSGNSTASYTFTQPVDVNKCSVKMTSLSMGASSGFYFGAFLSLSTTQITASTGGINLTTPSCVVTWELVEYL